MRVTHVIATSTGGVGQHVRSLVERLPGLGWDVTVVGPPETEAAFGFRAAGASFLPLDVAASPRPGRDVAAVRRLRRLSRGADVVHAHGFRAAAFAGLALGRRRPGRVPLVATWHNAVLATGPRRRLLAALERLAARRADVTLGASHDLVARARALGSPDARPAPVAAAPLPHPSAPAPRSGTSWRPAAAHWSSRSDGWPRRRTTPRCSGQRGCGATGTRRRSWSWSATVRSEANCNAGSPPSGCPWCSWAAATTWPT